MEADPVSVTTVLDLGSAVLLHGMLEKELEWHLRGLLDQAATEQLQREHEEFAESLELLNSLWRQEPDSPDLAPLSAAVLVRLRQHVAKDQRMMYDPLDRQPRPAPAPADADGR